MPTNTASSAVARCSCGGVQMEIVYPAFWAWHDHAQASQRAHASAYATYVGSWKSRFRVVKGAKHIRRFKDKATGDTRSFCGICGTPLSLERSHAPKWVNIPRAIFEGRTGREPRYHLHLEQAPEWAYYGGKLSPLKGYPGVMCEPRARKKHPATF